MRLLARVVEGGLGGCMTRRLIDTVEALCLDVTRYCSDNVIRDHSSVHT